MSIYESGQKVGRIFHDGSEVENIYSDGTLIYSAHRDYILNETVINLDGIDNTGSGHSGTATVWKNLIDSQPDATLRFAQWTGNSMISESRTAALTNYVSVPFVLPPTGDFTIEEVIRMDGVGSTYAPVICNTTRASGNGAVGFSRRASDGRLCLLLGTGTALVSSYTLTLGEIVNCSLVRQNGVFRIYVNGVLKGSVSNAGQLANQELRIFGGTPSAGDSSHNVVGNVYSLRIHHAAYTAEQLKNNYQVDKQRYQ